MAINDHDVIVGQSSRGGNMPSCRSGLVQHLTSLIPPGSGFTLVGATAINDNGQIAAGGNSHGQEHTFLLTPN